MSRTGKKMAQHSRPHDDAPAPRAGEIALDTDPTVAAGDACLVFIGRVHSPWKTRGEAPRNMAAAREAGGGALVEIDAPYRRGLKGLAGFSHVIVLTWLGQAPRNLIVQSPRHTSGPRGVFALRSPARPNPIGLHVAALEELDAAAGRLRLDAIDALDGTPVLDIKPYFATIDAFPAAHRPADRQEG